MLLLSPLVACGVPKRGGQTKYPRKTSEFGDSTAGCHGERNISQETHAREQALHYLWGAWGQPSTLEGLWGPFGCGSAGRKGGTAVKGEQGWYPYIENRLANLIYKCNKDVSIYFASNVPVSPPSLSWANLWAPWWVSLGQRRVCRMCFQEGGIQNLKANSRDSKHYYRELYY